MQFTSLLTIQKKKEIILIVFFFSFCFLSPKPITCFLFIQRCLLGSPACWDFYKNLCVLASLSLHLTFLEEPIPGRTNFLLAAHLHLTGSRKPPILAHLFQSKCRTADGKRLSALPSHPSVFPDLTPFPSPQLFHIFFCLFKCPASSPCPSC